MLTSHFGACGGTRIGRARRSGRKSAARDFKNSDRVDPQRSRINARWKIASALGESGVV
ncbi:uncharacterized protein METZ01_LOCUS346179, partial [marine metagenome]